MKRIYLSIETEEVYVGSHDDDEHDLFMKSAHFASTTSQVGCIGTEEDGIFKICRKLLEYRVSSETIEDNLDMILGAELSTSHMAFDYLLFDCNGAELYIKLDEPPVTLVEEALEINSTKEELAGMEDEELEGVLSNLTEDPIEIEDYNG